MNTDKTPSNTTQQPLWMWAVIVVSAFATILNTLQIIWCFPIWLVVNCILALYNLKIKQPAQGWLFIFYFGTSLLGWYVWAHK